MSDTYAVYSMECAAGILENLIISEFQESFNLIFLILGMETNLVSNNDWFTHYNGDWTGAVKSLPRFVIGISSYFHLL